MRFAVIALLACSGTAAQDLIDPAKIPPVWRDLRIPSESPKLACRVTSFPARLNFGFRFQAGYSVSMPAKQFGGPGRWVIVLFRVTPEDKERPAVYFGTRTQVPEKAPPNADLELGGGYLVGEGKYKVEWLLADDRGRVCGKNWSVTAKLSRKERGVVPGMPAGTVDEISFRRWSHGEKGGVKEMPRTVTILMHAAPLSLRRQRLGGYDRSLLLSALVSLLERLPVERVRLSAYNLDQQREIYQEDDFQPRDSSALLDRLRALELGTVDYDVLKNAKGHQELLADMTSSALEAKSDLVIFLGPMPRHFEKADRALLPEPGAARFFYLRFLPFWGGAQFSDTVNSVVRQLGGRGFDVMTPGDFAEAIRNIVKAL